MLFQELNKILISYTGLSVTKKPLRINNDPEEKQVAKNLHIQLTSHEASRYLELAKGTEFPTL